MFSCLGNGGVPIVLSTDFPRLIPRIGNADAGPAYGPCGFYEEAAGYAEYGTLPLMIAQITFSLSLATAFKASPWHMPRSLQLR